jgi:hypothetical protein
MLDEILDSYPDEDFLIADGLDEAIIGVDQSSMRLIYSVTNCISVLMKDGEMNEEDATDFFEFNVSGAYVGEKTPIWCYDNF